MTGEEGSELKDLDKNTYQVYRPLLDSVEDVLLPDVLEVKAAEYECNELQINKQWEHLFVPSSSPVVHSFKLPKGMMPRILEDEGLYIPRKPEICRRSYNKMENRLLKQEGGKNWFEESGEIISLPSPIKQSQNFRKRFPLKTGLGLKTIYKKVSYYYVLHCIITKSGGQRELYQLDLNISSLLFSHHPLFSQEHVLAARLLQLYECFQNRQQHNIALLLSEKLKALINATKIIESSLEASQLSRKTLDDYQWQIRDTKKLYDLEQKKDISLIHSMLKVWKQIKSVRRQQEYTSTPVKLQFQNSTQLAEIKEPLFIPHLTLTAEITAVSKCPIVPRNINAEIATGLLWFTDRQKLTEWAKEVKIDPNDPEYSDLMEFIMYARSKEQIVSKYFRLEQLQEEFNFVTEEEIKKCKRFQLLQLRNSEQLDFCYFRQIPLYDREIPDAVIQMRKLILKRFVKVKHKFNLMDIVSDYEEIISMSQLRNAVFKIGERRRHLKPQRKERKKVPAQTVSDGDVKLLIRVLRAYNIPSRNPSVTRSPGHDYSFSGLSKIKDNIYVNIFDEVRVEKHEICGTFQVNTPPVLLGYTWSKPCVSPKEHCGQNLKEYTFLTIFATIEPQLSSVENDLESDKFADHEDETLLQRACIFKKNCKAKFPKRRIITSVFDNEGRNILVTEYIRALNPPQLLVDMYLDDPNATFDLISQFVSLIPCVSDTLDENADVDIWMTSEHCINLAVGNKEEHAVLLCNYLLYFGKKAWVLLGTSVLEGKVAYVLTHENEEYFLWNPLNGQCYKQFDTFCPLQSIDCLINRENVWFNTQQNSSPMCVSFEISKEGFWRQFLPYNFQCIKTQTVQVTGYPIQMPYTDLPSISEAVYQTGIHSSEIPNTEFALAVYIHPYPNNILSVWIYLVSLVRHQ
uniref:Coiled-coil and C2 domain containing 2B n=1 Tax=Chelonoidis abingdonii TaxID=106734 RepID=A0A8C0IZK3_CHEAB